MDFTSKTRTISSIVRDIKNGKYNFNSPVQRDKDMWTKKMQLLLVDSLLNSYPINPIYVVKEEDKFSVIDGKQRLLSIYEFVNDKYKIDKDADPLVIKGVKYDISNKTYSKLADEVKETIKDYELQICTFTDCNYDNIREMFRRQNGGKPLNLKQLRTCEMNEEFAESLYSLKSHDFFKKILTAAQLRSEVARDSIIQAFMLIESNDENQYFSFKSKQMNSFIVNKQEEITTDMIEAMRSALDILNDSFIDQIKIPVTSLPMVLYSAYYVVQNGLNSSALVEKINEFVEGYADNEEYRQFVTDGTASFDKVKNRFNYWQNIINSIR